MAATGQIERLSDLLEGEIVGVRGEDDKTGGLVRVKLYLRFGDDIQGGYKWVSIDCLNATSGPFIDVAEISEQQWNEEW